MFLNGCDAKVHWNPVLALRRFCDSNTDSIMIPPSNVSHEDHASGMIHHKRMNAGGGKNVNLNSIT